MPAVYEGTFAPPPGRFALVAARFNHFVVEHLVAGAADEVFDDEMVEARRH